MSATLRNCPECGHLWPKDPDYALRGCGWLKGLSRNVSPSNSDLQIHDGVNGRNRFLQFEIKGPREEWPPQKGQLWTLRALDSIGNWTVRILRGTTRDIGVYRVDDDLVLAAPIRTYAEAMRRAIDAWLSGALWRDAESHLKPPLEAKPGAEHVHGWARVDGVWTCIQDHFASGWRPDTGCGATLVDQP